MSNFKSFLTEAGKGSTIYAYIYVPFGTEIVSGDEVMDELKIFGAEKDCVIAMIKDLKKDFKREFKPEEIDDFENNVDTLNAFFKKTEGSDWSVAFQAKAIKVL